MRRLSRAQRRMLEASGLNPRTGEGYGRQLEGAGQWATARSLVKLGLGDIHGGHPQGSFLPGLFFATRDGVAAVAPEPEEMGIIYVSDDFC